MPLLWTSAADVRSRWIADAVLDATDAQIETLLADVEDTILQEFPDLPARIASGFPLLRVRKVAARVVIRHLHNPDGVRQTTEGAGPYQSGVTYGGTEPGALALLDAERTELADGVTSGAFTFDLWRSTAAPLPPSIDPRLWGEG